MVADYPRAETQLHASNLTSKLRAKSNLEAALGNLGDPAPLRRGDPASGYLPGDFAKSSTFETARRGRTPFVDFDAIP